MVRERRRQRQSLLRPHGFYWVSPVFNSTAGCIDLNGIALGLSRMN